MLRRSTRQRTCLASSRADGSSGCGGGSGKTGLNSGCHGQHRLSLTLLIAATPFWPLISVAADGPRAAQEASSNLVSSDIYVGSTKYKEDYRFEAIRKIYSVPSSFLSGSKVVKSDEQFVYVYDDKFKFKECDAQVWDFLQQCLDAYKEHLEKYARSLLVRYMSAFQDENGKRWAVVFSSVRSPPRTFHPRTYELKGLNRGRFVLPTFSSVQQNHSIHLQDVNFAISEGEMTLPPRKRNDLLTQLGLDVDLLEKQGVKDYFLLVGILQTGQCDVRLLTHSCPRAADPLFKVSGFQDDNGYLVSIEEESRMMYAYTFSLDFKKLHTDASETSQTKFIKFINDRTTGRGRSLGPDDCKLVGIPFPNENDHQENGEEYPGEKRPCIVTVITIPEPPPKPQEVVHGWSVFVVLPLGIVLTLSLLVHASCLLFKLADNTNVPAVAVELSRQNQKRAILSDHPESSSSQSRHGNFVAFSSNRLVSGT
eukprot:TRINITY_DN67653_c0_g1_i1.p1 TRINITY_DN67653_c0_g1~~TRINITY_DN67653_c0_g1_i1.p1  ORF type:complete len:481 (+),score=36.08 TRINITY_DN67653_c0_g1_i1:66-1508(+)